MHSTIEFSVHVFMYTPSAHRMNVYSAFTLRVCLYARDVCNEANHYTHIDIHRAYTNIGSIRSCETKLTANSKTVHLICVHLS